MAWCEHTKIYQQFLAGNSLAECKVRTEKRKIRVFILISSLVKQGIQRH